MESDDVMAIILKGLILEYQEQPEISLFERILSRVDYLVLKVVNVERYRRPHLLNEDPQDLYSCAITGLYEGMNTVKETEEPGKVFARLIAYMKCAINRDFPYRVFPQEFLENQKEFVAEETVWASLEQSMVFEVVQTMIQEGILAQKDWDLVKLRFAQGLKYKDIANLKELSIGTVQKIVDETLILIRHQLKQRGVIE